MTSAAIKTELSCAGVKLKDIAAELGLSRTSISLVINGKSVSDRIQKAIAAKLNKPAEEIFPEYYSRKLRKITKPDEGDKQGEIPRAENPADTAKTQPNEIDVI